MPVVVAANHREEAASQATPGSGVSEAAMTGLVYVAARASSGAAAAAATAASASGRRWQNISCGRKSHRECGVKGPPRQLVNRRVYRKEFGKAFMKSISVVS